MLDLNSTAERFESQPRQIAPGVSKKRSMNSMRPSSAEVSEWCGYLEKVVFCTFFGLDLGQPRDRWLEVTVKWCLLFFKESVARADAQACPAASLSLNSARRVW